MRFDFSSNRQLPATKFSPNSAIKQSVFQISSCKQSVCQELDGGRSIGCCTIVAGSFRRAQNGSNDKLRRMRLVVECIGGTRLPTLQSYEEQALREGPSCVFVGPVETERKDRLEALYQQARDSYYRGQPLIVDDMFDKVEVYAFVRTDDSLHPRHKTECHVCEHPLVFHAKVERSNTSLSWPWAYGRVYLVTRAKDLSPQ